ncbi:MAG: hypothetical protein HY320_06755, partial [Armatimonadetes bacterium]|nr:hypothetical protein [Armatimonadota bacterium]
MDLRSLVDLPTLPVRITTRAVDPVWLPPNPGSTLRGAFGAALKALVCVRPDLPQCAPCLLVESCAYSYLFETRAPAGQPGTEGFETLPRPYVIRSAVGEQFADPGSLLTWCATLIGRAIEHFPYFVLAWREMGQRGIGRGRGRFDLQQVEALNLDGSVTETLYDRESNLVRIPTAVVGGPQLDDWVTARADRGTCAPEDLEVRFLTPTLLKYQGKPALAPDFHILWRVLQRRLSLLRLAHGAGRPDVDFAESIRQAEAIPLTRWSAREVTWNRYSRRQDQRVPMRG